MAPTPNPPQWHSVEPDALATHFASDLEQGLAHDEAERRLAEHGPNRLARRAGRSPLLRFLLQFHQPLLYILLGSALVTALLGEWVDAGVILGVVLVNAIVGFIQEGRAENALAALAASVASEVTVVRAGQRHRIDAVGLVPGDLVWLTAGDKVPADLRLVRATSLQAVEASLTGEAAPVSKQTASLPPDTLLADRANMAYAGTMVVAGQGAGLVIATGQQTEAGRISTMLDQVADLSTPLTRAMGRFSNFLMVAILGLAVLSFVVGLLRGGGVVDNFMAAIALAVAAIPEGLPAAITITLAIGVGRMARKRAIIRRLSAVEALGSTTVICSDKTGTLTENQMTVQAIHAGAQDFAVSGDGYAPHGELRAVLPDGPPLARNAALRETLLAGVLCNDAELLHKGRDWVITGDPTEGALLVAARKAGLDELSLRKAFPRQAELPFDSGRQFMATLHALPEHPVAYLKGALERLLPRASHMLAADGSLRPVDVAAVEQAAAAMAARGMRVLAFARLAAPAGADESAFAGGLVFLGLQGMIDPPRARAIGAVRTCHAAGIEVKMITGDHADTARAIAAQLGIARPGQPALTGRELAALDDEALRRAVREVPVFARVEPEQKLRLVQALQANGQIVAMTGDGVNDAPALKAADIGVAMGKGGTEVAKEAADMVLTDDNFATIEAAVEEGRGIYDNLVKFIVWSLPTNFGQGLVILAAVLLGAVLPITPLQILWVNMTSALLLGLFLAFEPIERGVMHRPPRPPKAPILDAVLLWRVLLVGLLMLAGAFGLFQLRLAAGASHEEARTVAVNTIIAVEIFYLFNCRSLTGAVWKLGWWSNPLIWLGVGLMVLAQLLFTYVPLMQRVFGSAPVSLMVWLQIVAAGAVAGLVVGLEKHLRARYARRQRG